MSTVSPRSAATDGVEKAGYPLWLRIGFWVCIVIAIAVVLRRVVELASPQQSGPPQLVQTNAVFASHAGLTLTHILPALAFVVLVPIVLLRWSKAAWLEQTLFILGLVVGITAYGMSAYAIGGWIERSAVLFFNSLFLFSLMRAYWHLRRGAFSEERRWLIRSIGILLGIATTRPVMGVFFATSRLTHLEPRQFFGIAFWVGFSINTIAVELWLHSKNYQLQSAKMASGPEA